MAASPTTKSQLNEHRRQTLALDAHRHVVYMCECDDAACLVAVVLLADEYDALRRRGLPLLAAGHTRAA